MEDGGPSATARRVAAHRLGFTRVGAGCGDPAAEDALAADVVGGLTVPASWMRDYLAARTAFFDRIVTGAIDRGVRQTAADRGAGRRRNGLLAHSCIPRYGRIAMAVISTRGSAAKPPGVP